MKTTKTNLVHEVIMQNYWEVEEGLFTRVHSYNTYSHEYGIMINDMMDYKPLEWFADKEFYIIPPE